MVVTLTPVHKGDTFYEKTVAGFHQNWDIAKGPHPRISHVFKVTHKNDKAARFHGAYKRYCERVGNVQYLYHGTKRYCRMGDHNDWTTPCNHPDCSLCGILKCSFDFKRAGSAHGKMFGNGVYTTSVTSKAVQYCESLGSHTNSNVILLSKVAVGRTCMLPFAIPILTDAPPGYDSVTGRTIAQGGMLLYPETVVYRPEAICVVGIIVFH